MPCLPRLPSHLAPDRTSRNRHHRTLPRPCPWGQRCRSSGAREDVQSQSRGHRRPASESRSFRHRRSAAFPVAPGVDKDETKVVGKGIDVTRGAPRGVAPKEAVHQHQRISRLTPRTRSVLRDGWSFAWTEPEGLPAEPARQFVPDLLRAPQPIAERCLTSRRNPNARQRSSRRNQNSLTLIMCVTPEGLAESTVTSHVLAPQRSVTMRPAARKAAGSWPRPSMPSFR
jgi:hypothetical protein